MFRQTDPTLKPAQLSGKPSLVSFEDIKGSFLEYLGHAKQFWIVGLQRQETAEDQEDFQQGIKIFDNYIDTFRKCENFIQFKNAIKHRDGWPHNSEICEILGKLNGTISLEKKIELPTNDPSNFNSLLYVQENFIVMAEKFLDHQTFESEKKLEKIEVKSDAVASLEAKTIVFTDSQNKEIDEVIAVFISYLDYVYDFYYNHSLLKDANYLKALSYVSDTQKLIQKFDACSTVVQLQNAITPMMSNAISTKASCALSLLSGKFNIENCESFLNIIDYGKPNLIHIAHVPFDQNNPFIKDFLAVHAKFLELAVNFFKRYKEQLSLPISPEVQAQIKEEKAVLEARYLKLSFLNFPVKDSEPESLEAGVSRLTL